MRICSRMRDPRNWSTPFSTVFHGGRYLSPAVRRKADIAATRPGLTARELEVLEWIVRGHSNQQIAREMGVSEVTVKFHVKNVLGKMGVTSRSKAAALGLQPDWCRPTQRDEEDNAPGSVEAGPVCFTGTYLKIEDRLLWLVIRQQYESSQAGIQYL